MLQLTRLEDVEALMFACAVTRGAAQRLDEDDTADHLKALGLRLADVHARLHQKQTSRERWRTMREQGLL